MQLANDLSRYCPFCCTYYRTTITLGAHLDRMHTLEEKKTVFKHHCPYCSLPFYNESGVYHHIYFVHKHTFGNPPPPLEQVPLAPCPVPNCFVMFNPLDQLNSGHDRLDVAIEKHCLEFHKTFVKSQYYCQFCTRHFKTYALLKRHFLMFHNFPCTECKMCFYTDKQMRDHYVLVHVSTRVDCEAGRRQTEGGQADVSDVQLRAQTDGWLRRQVDGWAHGQPDYALHVHEHPVVKIENKSDADITPINDIVPITSVFVNPIEIKCEDDIDVVN